MICLKCGYCCEKLSVMIVDDPDLGIIEGNIIWHKGEGKCKHLQGEGPGKYSCALHDKQYYSKTPCYQHSQIEQGNTKCRMGEYVLK